MALLASISRFGRFAFHYQDRPGVLLESSSHNSKGDAYHDRREREVLKGQRDGPREALLGTTKLE